MFRVATESKEGGLPPMYSLTLQVREGESAVLDSSSASGACATSRSEAAAADNVGDAVSKCFSRRLMIQDGTTGTEKVRTSGQ